MASTYTTNLGIEKIGTGEQSGTWGDTTNTNFDILDEAVNGIISITLSSAGSSGSPTALPITDGASSNGRNKFIEFVDGGDLGGTAYVQLTPNDAEKVVHIRNSLSSSRSVIVFQGTYNASNDFEIVNGADVLLKFNGGGSGATVTDVNVDLTVTGLTATTANATTVDTTNLEVTNIKAKDGTSAGSIADSTGVVTIASAVLTTADINGGTADNVTIGGSTAAVGTFTTANATTVDTTNIEVTNIKAKDGTSAGSIADSTGVVTLASSVLTTTDINGGTIDGAVIGGASAAAITATTITGTTITASTAVVPDASDGATLGSTSLEWSDLYLADGAVVYFGDDQDITLTHVADTGLTLKHANTGDDKFPTFLLATGDTDIAANDKLGVINFQAPDEGAGTDAILVAAGIEAVSEGDFSASSNATSLVFKTGASEAAAEKMRVDSSGNVSIGSSSNHSGARVVINDTRDNGGDNPGPPTSFGAPILQIGQETFTSSGLYSIGFGYTASGSDNPPVEIAAVTTTDGGSTKADIVFGTRSSTGNVAVTERMRLDTSGGLLVNTTSTQGGHKFSVLGAGSASSVFRRDTNDGAVINFMRASSFVGSISVASSSTAFNTSSDQRLKENIVDAPAGNIDGIRVRSFDWKVDGSHQPYGMVAQELVDVAPEVVTQGKNEDDMWQIDYSKLVPMMIKEIQDLKAEVAVLKEA
jgi:hypothetical protein